MKMIASFYKTVAMMNRISKKIDLWKSEKLNKQHITLRKQKIEK